MKKPIYDPQGIWLLEELIKVAIADEKAARERYRKLASMAKKEKDKKLLCDISRDKKGHLKALRCLYHALFGKEPHETEPCGERFGRFAETIGKSIVSEYRGISFYREILGRIEDDSMRMPVRRIMADKQRHAEILEGMLDHK